MTAIFISFSCCLGKFSSTKSILNFADHNHSIILKLFSESEILQYFRFNWKYCSISETIIVIIVFFDCVIIGLNLKYSSSLLRYDSTFDSVKNIFSISNNRFYITVILNRDITWFGIIIHTNINDNELSQL